MLAGISCRGSEPAGRPPAAPAAPPAAETPAPPARETPPRIVALGDSLTAGLGLSQNEAYPALLQRKVKENGYPHDVINAGVSGDTSADGLRRVNWALDGNVRLVILALGANDALRGLSPSQMKGNLQGIIHRVRQRGIPVLFVGMEAPPNYGEEYAKPYRQVFFDLARENKVAFVPFLLDGVAGVPGLNQADNIHPSSAGAARIADHLWPAVEKMIRAEADSGSADQNR